MSGAKHTPGPWEVGKTSPRTIYQRSDDETFIATCGSGEPARYQEEKANARLIAAAPELLEALSVAAERLEARGHAMGAREARAAIAKATGSAA